MNSGNPVSGRARGKPVPNAVPANTAVGDALKCANKRVAPIDARLLMQRVLRRSHAQLIAHPEYLLTVTELAEFELLLRRREAGEPVAYLIGEREFFGLSFTVTPDVLIPRPETELLVELALLHLPEDAPRSVLDLGTGSGAIAITLAARRPLLDLVATDESADALRVAASNARRLLPSTPTLALPRRGEIRFLESEWFSELGSLRFDLIIANPPYVAANDPHLEQGDVRFEPRSALIGGGDGLRCIRHIVAHAREYLKPGGWLLFEHGYDQADACCALLQAAAYVDILSRRDLAGIPRLAGGRSWT
ncbi:MAG: peptide chain release factor N(5)-glutamine methyltransferase [Burkholderiales bacterium]